MKTIHHREQNSRQPTNQPTNQPDYSYHEAIKILSPSEIRVLDIVERGHTNKEIAIELCLSVETIKTHKKNICKKLGLYGRNGLIKWLLSTINGRNE